jgi:hypothetical protein
MKDFSYEIFIICWLLFLLAQYIWLTERHFKHKNKIKKDI